MILPNLQSVFCISKFCLNYSYVAIFILPFIALLYFAIKRNFIRFFDKGEQTAYERGKSSQRMIFFLLRSLIFALVLFSIASPFLLETKTVKGNPRIMILVDNSTSLNLFEGGIEKELAGKLKGKIPATVRHIATGDESAIANGILNNLERDENVLVISDGNNNEGKLLGDVMFLASSLNATVSTIKMEPIKSDVSVAIEGANEAIRDTEETFFIKVKNVGKNVPYIVEVRFDDEIVISKSDDKSNTFTLRKKLSEGYHKISAELLNVGSNDYFAQNNQYYKVVKVVARPKVLFVSEKSSLLANELKGIYDLTVASSIPNDLSGYLAVILNDIDAKKFLPHVTSLSKYVSDGNGLFVIGGQNSYDRGSYKGTLIETLLPVKTGTGEESEKSDVNIVIVIDISQGTANYVSIEKAQAVSIIESLDKKNNVGVVAFNTVPYKVADIKPLSVHKKEVVDKTSKLIFDGQSFFNLGIDAANKMLTGASGGKNIILITDGKTTFQKLMDDTKESAKEAAARGMRIYVAGVGERRNDVFLDEVAHLGEGTYFPVDASNKLKILFGEPESKEEKEFFNRLVLLDTTHFITYNQSIDAVISGYNYVVPKPASRLLITTNKNIPIMVAWRFGLGRVVSLATDDGSKWSSEIFNKENSKILTKAINWVIGDLSRKKEFDVTIRDASLGKPLIVNVVSAALPKHEKLNFVKADVNLYASKFYADKIGFYNFLGADAAVNYKDEFKNLGVNPEFLKLVEQTQGKVFEKEDINGILDFVKEKSKRIKIDKTELKWPFLIAALIVLLGEITLRRLWENKDFRK
ncbi:VWA domain-containing protein [Candidatus Woesearchaeota archaeon]|nr:VWA domain-containing protein [Candidatus Woesearchaeota archaeon]